MTDAIPVLADTVPRDLSSPLPAEASAARPSRLVPPDPLFDEFWAVYPRKVGKAGAQRDWQRTRRKGADLQQVIAAAGQFRDECRVRGTEQKFIPHPGSWLSKERYKDDAPEPAPVIAPMRMPGLLNDEQLLAAVIRLADHKQPVSAAQVIIATVRRHVSSGAPEDFPAVSAERGRELSAMPYPEYLETPEWHARRKVMLTRADYRCQVCNRDRSLHVHHRTYERRGVELPADLTVLCDECHALYHGKGLLASQGDVA